VADAVSGFISDSFANVVAAQSVDESSERVASGYWPGAVAFAGSTGA